MSGVAGQAQEVSPSQQTAIEYVRDLQADGRLILRFSARRPDRQLATILPLAASADGSEAVSAYRFLTADPAIVAADSVQFATLVACVDDLSRKAAPATVASIRLSSAYLRIPLEGNEPPTPVTVRANALRKVMHGLIWIAGIATTTVVLLLAHVDDGRRAVQQLQDARAELAGVEERLAQTPPTAWVIQAAANANQIAPNEGFKAYCPEDSDGNREPGRHPRDTAEGARAAGLCGQRNQAALRLELIFVRLATWNQRTSAIFLFPAGDWLCRRFYGRSACQVVARANPSLARHWQRTEIRTTGAISVLTGFVLPLLLGCVGGCAYVLRRLDQKLSEWTLQFHDGSHAMLRVLLATMLGGLLGVIWTGNDTVQIQGFTLSLAAAAFFVGFSLEVVFTVIEAMVEGVAGKLKTQAAAPWAPQQVTTSARPPTAPLAPASVANPAPQAPLPQAPAPQAPLPQAPAPQAPLPQTPARTSTNAPVTPAPPNPATPPDR